MYRAMLFLFLVLSLAACDKLKADVTAPPASESAVVQPAAGTAAPSVNLPTPSAPTPEQWLSFTGKCLALQVQTQQQAQRCQQVVGALTDKARAQEAELRRLKGPDVPLATPPSPPTPSGGSR